MAKKDRQEQAGKTLAEKLAENGPMPGAESEFPVENCLDAADADVLDVRALSQKDGAGAANSDTDEIVRKAKSMRDVEETRQAKSKTCLIVDDSRVMRKVSSKIAVSLGYQVVEAENGEEALARCKQRMPNLILTDWQMPVMSGPEFVAALRAIPTPVAPTIVFCTSKGTAKDVHEGIRAGADDYIVKPFEETALKAKLEKLGVG